MKIFIHVKIIFFRSKFAENSLVIETLVLGGALGNSGFEGILLNVLSTKAIKFKMLITNTSYYSKGPGHCPLGHYHGQFCTIGTPSLRGHVHV